jgi:ribonucleoside-diphosphate reductase beta chain
MNDMLPVKASDKRVVNGKGDINQLMPLRYAWAWEYFLNANKNHWTPLEVPMGPDIADYRNLSPAEKHVYENVLAYLTTSDILAMRNIGLAVMEKMSAPELQIYQARQVYEESLHTWTYQNCIENLGLNQGEIYNRYRVVPEINAKIQIANRRMGAIMATDLDLTDRKTLHTFAMSYLFFSAVFEGAWFYNGFTPIFSMQRRGLMKATGEQFQFIFKDEAMHASFGLRVIKTMLEEEGLTLDQAEVDAMWAECHQAEEDYIKYILRDPILGYSVGMHMGQFRYVANRRMRTMGLPDPYPGAVDCVEWLDEQIGGTKKEKNFFESRVSEYQTGGALQWDE